MRRNAIPRYTRCDRGVIPQEWWPHALLDHAVEIATMLRVDEQGYLARQRITAQPPQHMREQPLPPVANIHESDCASPQPGL